MRILAAALAFALCFIAPARAQDAIPRLRERDTSEVAMQSRAGLEYRVMLSVPRGPAPEGGFPVIYVLDGDGWFGAAVEVARVREWGRISPSIVVGIGYPSRAFFDGARRNYDFTPPGATDPGFEDAELGGSDAFLEFLTQTVKPWVREHYAIDLHKQILFGHSMGALFVLHTMYTAPESFDVYLAASPPIRFSDRLLAREVSVFEAKPGRTAVRALITVGEFEARPSPQQIDDYRRYFTAHPEASGGEDIETALRNMFPVTPGFNKTRELRQLAARLARAGADVSFVEFAGEEHASSAISALNRGIPFALRPPAH